MEENIAKEENNFQGILSFDKNYDIFDVNNNLSNTAKYLFLYCIA